MRKNIEQALNYFTLVVSTGLLGLAAITVAEHHNDSAPQQLVHVNPGHAAITGNFNPGSHLDTSQVIVLP